MGTALALLLYDKKNGAFRVRKAFKNYEFSLATRWQRTPRRVCGGRISLVTTGID